MDVYRNFFIAGGWLMVPLVACVFGIWYCYFSLLWRLKEQLSGPDITDLNVPQKVCAGSVPLQRLQARLSEREGALPRVVRQCALKISQGMPFREALAQCRQAEMGEYSYRFYVMGALVTAAPLLGLLGTVLGMITTFTGVGLQSGQTADMVAGGISRALITTQAGLVAALPGTFGLAHLYRLFQRLHHTMDRCESHLALAWEHGSQNGTGGTAEVDS
ncbi:MAG: MotA/TolQ/ExbB proton channel family protein [Candidatus Pacebacteria bacterium]|nr:MotA/TolQ/ExbB proton channel family protein [Candidatus Paceibacterota bacterium]